MPAEGSSSTAAVAEGRSFLSQHSMVTSHMLFPMCFGLPCTALWMKY